MLRYTAATTVHFVSSIDNFNQPRAPVVYMVNSALYWVQKSCIIQLITQLVSLILITELYSHWIVIYLVDSKRLNNRRQKCNV